MKWFEKLAARRKPTSKSPSGFYWQLFHFWKLHIRLIVKTHSTTDSRVCQMASLSYVLQGAYLEHRLYGEKDEGDYEYHDAEGRWVVHDVQAREFRAWGVGEKQRIELYPAQNTADKIIDMPEWMALNDVDFNTEKQVWILSFGWGR